MHYELAYEYDYDEDEDVGTWVLLFLMAGLGSICTLMTYLYYRYVWCEPSATTTIPRYGRYLVGIVGQAGHGKDSIGNVLVREHGFQHDAFAKPLKDAARIMWLLSEKQLYGDQKEVVDERWQLSPRVLLQRFGTEVGRELFAQWMPHIGERFWLEHLKRRREALLAAAPELASLQGPQGTQKPTVKPTVKPTAPTNNMVVCDVRFPNEAELIKDLGGILVKVVRPNHNSFSASAPPSAPSTPSPPSAPSAPEAVSAADAAKIESKIECKSEGQHKSETMMAEIRPDLVLVNDGTLKDLDDQVNSVLVPFILRPPTPKKARSRKCD